MKQWDISEAARRLHEQMGQQDTHVVWFLGAGCSISSGIPGAGTLVGRWLDGLRDLKGDAFDAWVEAHCPDWAEAPARSYGAVIDERFGGNRRARQEEIARLVAGKEPGFGYACLAQLMTHPEHGRRNNLAFTTNFDDLIADALYLYTRHKPLTVHHEALAGFLRSSEVTPLVVKLHGDSQLAPKNTAAETTTLDEELIVALRRVLRDAVFVFIGYGGNDASIASFLEGCRADEIAGAYWVSPDLPGNERFRAWLTSLEGAVHVDHQDFDAFMAELQAEFGLGTPDFDRFDKLKKSYEETARRLTGASARGADAAGRSVSALDAWRLDAEARGLGHDDPARREHLHRRAIETAPDDPVILSSYGVFLNEQDRVPEAEEWLTRALAAAPDSPDALTRYGAFLHQRGRLDEALAVLDRAMESPAARAVAAASKAAILHEQGELDKAAETYQQALAELDDPIVLTNYGLLLDQQGRLEEADPVYARIDPERLESPVDMANLTLARFRRGDREGARRLLVQAFDHQRPPYVGHRYQALWVELDLYAYADATPGHEDALTRLKGRLVGGERSKGWDFSPVVDAVDPDPARRELLRALAAVAADQAPIETLDGFEEWRDA